MSGQTERLLYDTNPHEERDDHRQTDESLLLLTDSHSHVSNKCWKWVTSEGILFGIGFLPITFAILILSALGINYGIAVSKGHVSAVWPYVSWLTSNGPEGYIFDFLLSLASINVAFIIYFKFKVILSLHLDETWIRILTINKVCSYIGFITSFLFLMSATFPAVDEKSILKVHSVASIAGFSILCIYFIIETVMSFYIRQTVPGITMCVCITRVVFTFLCCTFLIVCAVAGDVASKKSPQPKDPKHYRPTDGGYALHLVATFSEWGIVLTMVAYFLTYVAELKNFKTNIRVAVHEEAIPNRDAPRSYGSSNTENQANLFPSARS